MKVTEIEVRPQWMKSAGRPFAFVGGFIGLEPQNEKYFCVGHAVTLHLEDSPSANVVIRNEVTIHLDGAEFTNDELVEMCKEYETKPEFAGLSIALAARLAELYPV